MHPDDKNIKLTMKNNKTEWMFYLGPDILFKFKTGQTHTCRSPFMVAVISER